MSEELQALLSFAGDEGPPSDFAATLRTALLDEAERIEDGTGRTSSQFDDIDRSPISDIPVGHVDGDNLIDLRGAGDSTDEDLGGSSYLRWIAAAAAIAIIVAGVLFGLPDGDEGGLETFAPPEESTSSTTIELSAQDSPDGVFDPTATVLETRGSLFFPASNVLTEQNSRVEPGIYRSNVLGTPVSINLLDPFEVLGNGFGSLRFDDAETIVPDQTIYLDRISALSNPVDPSLPFEDSEGWPADDVAGWLSALPESVLVSDLEQTSLGGSSALRFELSLAADACQAGDTCAYFGSNHGLNEVGMIGAVSYEIWVVDQQGEDPIAVIAADLEGNDLEWQARAREIVGTIGFGPIEPNPVSNVASGVAELASLDGIRIELPNEELLVMDSGRFDRVRFGNWAAETTFAARPSTLDGQVIATADELSDLLSSLSALVDEVEPTTIGGFEARVFDIEGSAERAFFVDGEAETAWLLPTQGRLWAIEHPERGLLLISADIGLSTSAPAWPFILERTELIIASLEFI